MEWQSPTPLPTVSSQNIPPSSQDSSTNSPVGSNLRISARGLRPSDEEKLWLEGSNKEKFWQSVAQRFEASTGRQYRWESCRRTVNNEVKRRREYLKSYETGKASEPKSDLHEAIDMWTEILDQQDMIVLASQASAEQRRLDAAVDDDFRRQFTERLGQSRVRNESTISSTTSATEDTEDSEHPKRRRRTRLNDEEDAMTTALVDLTKVMSESLLTTSQESKDMSTVVENIERRLEHLEANYIRTNELLERLISKLN
ncbi:hypothetical protein TSTA_000890 [Talaromyces stipitatus ATCC 10500]|uniref:Uncharacterized protein n=1 Tax=Talaromyces stipitatus (strain ATCC 10500 / CBS 375.48 / QM 6759 / NRRL 1006) TaxID=441959 RepID=B8MSV8_TALSN|nr:uncharacterized protein TSTA_000890 [Talaromyces stipitatus ATCC 10500]EED12017.1 hypothetical protein TSTA_000890 [Talaromyces stipitatus ATCC 10500]